MLTSILSKVHITPKVRDLEPLVYTSPYPKTLRLQFSRFCRGHGRVQHTDHATPFVAMARI